LTPSAARLRATSRAFIVEGHGRQLRLHFALNGGDPTAPSLFIPECPPAERGLENGLIAMLTPGARPGGATRLSSWPGGAVDRQGAASTADRRPGLGTGLGSRPGDRAGHMQRGGSPSACRPQPAP